MDRAPSGASTRQNKEANARNVEEIASKRFTLFHAACVRATQGALRGD
jgi:hypothetical protein